MPSKDLDTKVDLSFLADLKEKFPLISKVIIQQKARRINMPKTVARNQKAQN
jgi:hypothetical protein